MEKPGRIQFIWDPKFQVITTWAWNFVGAFIVTMIAAIVLPANIVIDRNAIWADPRLAFLPILAEIVTVGLAPIFFTILSRDDLARYGIQKQGLWKSLGFSALVVAVYSAGVHFRLIKSFPIPFTGNPVGRSMMCENVIDNHPFNETVLFSIANGKAVCFTYLTQVSKKIILFHNWYKADKLSSRFPLPIEPLQGFTLSKIELRESDKGAWRVEITDEGGNLLKILRFSITD